jgi:hypothetical protein
MFAQCLVCAFTKCCKLFGMNCLIFDLMRRKCMLFRFAMSIGITVQFFRLLPQFGYVVFLENLILERLDPY